MQVYRKVEIIEYFGLHSYLKFQPGGSKPGIFPGIYSKCSRIGLVCGINTIVDYAPIILESAGWKIEMALFATFILGFVNLTFTFAFIFTIERVGREDSDRVQGAA